MPTLVFSLLSTIAPYVLVTTVAQLNTNYYGSQFANFFCLTFVILTNDNIL